MTCQWILLTKPFWEWYSVTEQRRSYLSTCYDRKGHGVRFGGFFYISLGYNVVCNFLIEYKAERI